jgi:demethylmenaquinone methyltransferase/2-methoxy-6-polyprenyl-1,4-benzoquinol methylase
MLELGRLRAVASGASSGAGSVKASSGRAAVGFVCGDMTSLPFGNGLFDLVTTGYGLRNVPDLDAAIDEIARVLKPGGRLLSLDFNRPESTVIRSAYLAYLTVVGSTLGWVLHRDPDTYRYIPASIRRYPGARGVANKLGAHGFRNVRIVPLLFGLMTLHLAERSS